MKNIQSRILLVNLFLLLTLFTYKSTVYGIMEGFHVAILIVLNLLISIIFFIRKDKALGKAFLLATGLMLLIGFGVCVIKFQVYQPSYH